MIKVGTTTVTKVNSITNPKIPSTTTLNNIREISKSDISKIKVMVTNPNINNRRIITRLMISNNSIISKIMMCHSSNHSNTNKIILIANYKHQILYHNSSNKQH